MATRPIPTPLFHFTHINHLPAVVEHGLMCDTGARDRGLLVTEVGNQEIKTRRRTRVVPVEPRGVVAHYAPFYFAPRSPMLSAIHHGRVAGYNEGIDPLVYLVTTVERLVDLRATLVTTDRNAAVQLATFYEGTSGLDQVDWQLMRATIWKDTADEPDRRERRMAECLVHDVVPWAAFTEVRVRSKSRRAQVEAILAATADAVPVTVAPGWYF